VAHATDWHLLRLVLTSVQPSAEGSTMGDGRRPHLAWRKSTYSAASGCVEVAVSGDLIYVRDSKLPSGPVLAFTEHEWKAFVMGAKIGEFDPHALRET
jgi:hypothetical protein